MKFAIINDMHVSAPGMGYENGVQRKLVGKSEELIKKFVDEMNSTEHPEFVVNLGDTIEDVGTKEGDLLYFDKAIKLLSGLKMPIYYLIGNHDVKTNNVDEIAKLLGYDKLYYSWDVGNYHFISLSFERDMDEKSLTYRVSSLSEAEINWLKQDLSRTSKPTVVFSHYGLADDDMVGNFWFEKIADRAVIGNRAKIRRIFEKSGKVRAVISAHQHWNRMFIYNGIPYITVTSLVENFNNDGIAAEAYTIVNLDRLAIEVDVRGYDPATYNFEFPE